MNKLLTLLLFTTLLISCSSDNDNPLNSSTDPQRGDEVTTEQIVGTYKASSIRFDNTGYGFFSDAIELTFNPDKTGEEWNPRTLAKAPFTWSYSDRVITFSYSLHKNIKGWFDKSNLMYRAYYINSNGNTTEQIATHTFIKK